MKYMCKTCKKPCNDIPKHIRKVHGFSEAHIKEDLKNKPDAYKNAFEDNKMTKKKPNRHNAGGSSKQKRRKENKQK